MEKVRNRKKKSLAKRKDEPAEVPESIGANPPEPAEVPESAEAPESIGANPSEPAEALESAEASESIGANPPEPDEAFESIEVPESIGANPLEPAEVPEPAEGLKDLLIGKLILETTEYLEFEQTHLFRGYIGNTFPQYELLHNHQNETQGLRYRYPLIQYKIIQGTAMIVGIGEQAIQVLQNIFPFIKRLVMHGHTLIVQNKNLEIEHGVFGISPEERRYVFITPSILLNSENYQVAKKSDEATQIQILQKCLQSNLLSISKGLGYTVPSRIYAKYDLTLQKVCLKGESMIGFLGNFAVNFYIPDFLGIGKSSSRGYGCCVGIQPAVSLG